MAKKLVIAAARIKPDQRQSRRFRKSVGRRLTKANDTIDAMIRRFDIYTDLANGAAPTTETLIEDHAMLLELRRQVTQLNAALGFHDVND